MAGRAVRDGAYHCAGNLAGPRGQQMSEGQLTQVNTRNLAAVRIGRPVSKKAG
jgi:hypothetical protein